MFDTSALNGGTGVSGSSGAKQSADARGKSDMGQEDFLKLMITQFQNQDPFQPMESGEFLGQLAHFTTANGIGELRQAFEGFADQMLADQGLRAAGLVGRQVLVEGGHGHLPADGELTGAVSVPGSVEQIKISIYNASGERVRELQLGSREIGQAAFAWDGADERGRRVPEGRYKLSAEAHSNGKTTGLDILVGARVNSVTLGRGGESPTLSLDGLGEHKLSAVRHIQ